MFAVLFLLEITIFGRMLYVHLYAGGLVGGSWVHLVLIQLKVALPAAVLVFNCV